MYTRYLLQVIVHKWFVFIEACRLGIPWLGVIHDLSKLSPAEFFPYARAKAVSGVNRSPVDADHSLEMDYAWLNHQKKNKHHWQYWTIQSSKQLYAIQQHSYNSPMVLSLGKKQMLEVFAPAWEKDDEIHTLAYRRLVDIRDRLNYNNLLALPMPDRYRREMLADWRGAGRTYGNTDTRAWYIDNREKMTLHPETAAWIESELGL